MMLQNQAYQDQLAGEDVGEFLTPARAFEIVKRRALYFIVPFVLVFAIGCLIALAWPAKFVSEGKILVQSQEIPSDLVRPTVVSLANARIQIIEQRVMTRDNLLSIAKKFQISQNSWQGFLPGTEIVDFIRSRTQIRPLELKLRGERKQAIAFTVGFEYELPQIAMKVANELVTMILNEDVRARTNYAAETTKFLERDVKRLEAQLGELDSQIAELKRRSAGTLLDPSKFNGERGLAALKADLLIKSATYSDSHPDVRALKRKIAALEKSIANGTYDASEEPTDSAASSSDIANNPAIAIMSELDSLLSKRAGLRTELNNATVKLSTARLGESLERGQHSERLEVIEQPTLPQKPTSPNRSKIFLIAFVAALMAGGGLALGSEMLDQSVRRSTDLYSMIDSHLVVSIPYITTHAEVRGKKRKIIVASGILAVAVLGSLVAVLFILPPLDIVFAKVMTALLK